MDELQQQLPNFDWSFPNLLVHLRKVSHMAVIQMVTPRREATLHINSSTAISYTPDAAVKTS
jgi:hypothetical protein